MHSLSYIGMIRELFTTGKTGSVPQSPVYSEIAQTKSDDKQLELAQLEMSVNVAYGPLHHGKNVYYS